MKSFITAVWLLAPWASAVVADNFTVDNSAIDDPIPDDPAPSDPSPDSSSPDNSTQSGCFNYFLKKDNCVHAAVDPAIRCPANTPNLDYSGPVQSFTLRNQHSKRADDRSVERRYDTTNPNFPVASGTGICGDYNSTEVIGVCLWSGPEQSSPSPDTSGWLNGPLPINCGKKVFVQRKGQPETVQYAYVLDGCSFNSKSYDDGCFQIGVSLALFEKFNPSPQERAKQLLYNGLSWDFLSDSPSQ